ncbi:MAG: NF038143 family protein [Desulfobacterales bacterium]
MATHREKKEFILHWERAVANAVGGNVFEKPQASFWMILLPILFLYFLYRMQKYKTGRLRFEEEFLRTRLLSLDLADAAVATGGKPDIERAVRESGLIDRLEGPYTAWIRELVEFYMDLLQADGGRFEELVRSAFRNRAELLLRLNRLNRVEQDFYRALRPSLSSTEGAQEILNAMAKEVERLRREMAGRVFA